MDLVEHSGGEFGGEVGQGFIVVDDVMSVADGDDAQRCGCTEGHANAAGQVGQVSGSGSYQCGHVADTVGQLRSTSVTGLQVHGFW
ncbi:hypothetical protein D3C77_587410 [compost metagenome]